MKETGMKETDKIKSCSQFQLFVFLITYMVQVKVNAIGPVYAQE